MVDHAALVSVRYLRSLLGQLKISEFFMYGMIWLMYV